MTDDIRMRPHPKKDHAPSLFGFHKLKISSPSPSSTSVQGQHRDIVQHPSSIHNIYGDGIGILILLWKAIVTLIIQEKIIIMFSNTIYTLHFNGKKTYDFETMVPSKYYLNIIVICYCKFI